MLGSSRRAIGTYRRTTLVGLASAALLVGGLGPAAGQGTQDAGFSNGMAKATAVVTKIAPGVGSLELALANGIAVAELKNKLTQAQAQSLDLGLIGTTLTAEGCRDAALTADELPQPTRVDNRQGDAEAASDELPIADSTLGGGREAARATATSAAAVATSASSVSPVLEVAGGRAEASTRSSTGPPARPAPSVGLDLTIADTVTLGGLRWVAVHRTGRTRSPPPPSTWAPPRSSASPSPSSRSRPSRRPSTRCWSRPASRSSCPVSSASRRRPTSCASPSMRIVLKDSPLGKTVLGPGLDLTREQRFNLFNDLAGAHLRRRRVAARR